MIPSRLDDRSLSGSSKGRDSASLTPQPSRNRPTKRLRHRHLGDALPESPPRHPVHGEPFRRNAVPDRDGPVVNRAHAEIGEPLDHEGFLAAEQDRADAAEAVGEPADPCDRVAADRQIGAADVASRRNGSSTLFVDAGQEELPALRDMMRRRSGGPERHGAPA